MPELLDARAVEVLADDVQVKGTQAGYAMVSAPSSSTVHRDQVATQSSMVAIKSKERDSVVCRHGASSFRHAATFCTIALFHGVFS